MKHILRKHAANRIEKLKMDAAKEGESAAHEMSETPEFEKAEEKGLVKDAADRKKPSPIGAKSPKDATKKLIDIRR